MKKWIMCAFTVCLLAVALSVTAFAEDGIQSVTPEAGEAGKNVTVSNKTNEKFTLAYTAAETGKQYLVVVSSDENKTLNENTIYYIDQVEAKSGGATFDVYPKTLSEGTYYVYLSSNAAGGVTALAKVATIKATGPAYTPGDVNADGNITVIDALAVLQISVGKGTWTETQLLAAEVNGTPPVTVTDALWVLQASVGKREL